MIIHEKRWISLITYEPLWQTLKLKNISQYQLIHQYGFSTGTLDSLRKGRSLNLSTIETICEMLNVSSITEIVEYIPDNLEK
jgi:conserved domain protein